MATTGMTAVGMWQAFALLRRIKSVVQGWRGGKKTVIDLDAVRRAAE
jgi:hypothetical protein